MKSHKIQANAVPQTSERLTVTATAAGVLSYDLLIPMGAKVEKAVVVVTDAFSGTAPTISVGSSSDAEAFMSASVGTLNVVGEYTSEAGKRFKMPEQSDCVVRFTITNDVAATDGEVVFYVDFGYEPNTTFALKDGSTTEYYNKPEYDIVV